MKNYSPAYWCYFFFIRYSPDDIFPDEIYSIQDMAWFFSKPIRALSGKF